MANTLDAEKALNVLVRVWADQYGQKVTRRGSNEENINSANNRASNY